jgi:hypothetical protein
LSTASALPPLPASPPSATAAGFDRSDFRAEKAAKEAVGGANPSTRDAALRELDVYSKMAVEHSYRQYAHHGTLHDWARKAMASPDLWEKPWVPWDFDLGKAREHHLWQRFSHKQKLAWNHLQWGLDYTIVGRGEQQIIVLNNHAVAAYEEVLPSVVELEKRESFEEIDHLAAFNEGLEGLRKRYLPQRKKPLWARSPSGFESDRLNRASREAVGRLARYLLGANFPTLFFLTRGMKTHNFKPFENAIASFEEAPDNVRMISHLHRLDESRHMATSLYLAKLSNVVLETLHHYWRDVLENSPTFADLTRAEREDLLAHIRKNLETSLLELHPRQAQLTRQANKRIVENAGLSPEYRKIFVELLREDSKHAVLVDAVDLEA